MVATMKPKPKTIVAVIGKISKALPRAAWEEMIAKGDFQRSGYLTANFGKRIEDIQGFPKRVWIEGDDVKAEFELLIGQQFGFMIEDGVPESKFEYTIGGRILKRSEDGAIQKMDVRSVSVAPRKK